VITNNRPTLLYSLFLIPNLVKYLCLFSSFPTSSVPAQTIPWCLGAPSAACVDQVIAILKHARTHIITPTRTHTHAHCHAHSIYCSVNVSNSLMASSLIFYNCYVPFITHVRTFQLCVHPPTAAVTAAARSRHAFLPLFLDSCDKRGHRGGKGGQAE
jgi:hypothetical protein